MPEDMQALLVLDARRTFFCACTLVLVTQHAGDVALDARVILAPPALSSVILYGVDILCVVGFV